MSKNQSINKSINMESQHNEQQVGFGVFFFFDKKKSTETKQNTTTTTKTNPTRAH
jgi:hypothetical protein